MTLKDDLEAYEARVVLAMNRVAAELGEHGEPGAQTRAARALDIPQGNISKALHAKRWRGLTVPLQMALVTTGSLDSMADKYGSERPLQPRMHFVLRDFQSWPAALERAQDLAPETPPEIWHAVGGVALPSAPAADLTAEQLLSLAAVVRVLCQQTRIIRKAQ